MGRPDVPFWVFCSGRSQGVSDTLGFDVGLIAVRPYFMARTVGC